MNASSLRLLATIVIVAALGLLAGDLASQTVAPVQLTILAREGRRTIPITLVNDQEFVAVDDLVNVFQLTTRDDALGALTITDKGKTIVLTSDQAIASVSGRLVSLPAPPTRNGRRWLVPVEFINRGLGLVHDAKLDLRKPSHLLVVGDLRVPRVTVRYELAGPGGRLTIEATPRATSTVTQDAPDRLGVRFDADALDVQVPPLPPQGPASLVQDVRLLDATTLAVDLSPRITTFRATSLPVDNTIRLTIDIATAEVAAAPAPSAATPPAPAPGTAEPLPPLGQGTIAFRTIALDPGHGGADEGVKGPGGTKEKDLTLTVARRIKAAIEGRLGIRVLLTREDDRNPSFDDRTAVANNNKADLFISLHANASFRPSASGVSIYTAAFEARTGAEPAAQGRGERVPTFAGVMRDLELVAWDRAQTRYIDQSTAFAGLLLDQLHDRVPVAGRPTMRAPLGVLESANMPAVLVEMGFLTSADQEKQLTGAEFQAMFVQAVSDAVVRFRDSQAGAR